MYEIYLEIEPDLIIESSNKDKLMIEKLKIEKSELEKKNEENQLQKDEVSRQGQVIENMQKTLEKLKTKN